MQTIKNTLLEVILGIFILSCGGGNEHVKQGDQLAVNWQLDAALKEYKMAFEQDSLNPELLNKMGLLFVKMEKYPDAIAAFDSSLKYKEDESVKANLTTAQQMSNAFNMIHHGDYKSAIDIYQTILKNQPNQVIARKNLAYCYYVSEDTSVAIVEFEKVKNQLKDQPSSDLYQVIDEQLNKLKSTE